jgi:hypothetical protein
MIREAPRCRPLIDARARHKITQFARRIDGSPPKGRVRADLRPEPRHRRAAGRIVGLSASDQGRAPDDRGVEILGVVAGLLF